MPKEMEHTWVQDDDGKKVGFMHGSKCDCMRCRSRAGLRFGTCSQARFWTWVRKKIFANQNSSKHKKSCFRSKDLLKNQMDAIDKQLKIYKHSISNRRTLRLLAVIK